MLITSSSLALFSDFIISIYLVKQFRVYQFKKCFITYENILVIGFIFVNVLVIVSFIFNLNFKYFKLNIKFVK